MKFILHILILFLVFINVSKTQSQTKGFSIEIGLNTVDVRTYTSNIGESLKDYFGTDEWSGNTSFLSRVAIQKYFGNDFALQLVGSINSLNTVVTENDSNSKYSSFDLVLKRNLKSIFANKNWLDTYLLLGLGYQTVDKNSDTVLIGGLGFNISLSDRYGINFQTGYKHGLNPTGTDVFQHSISLIYNFSINNSSNSSRGRKRSWNN